MMSLLCEHDSWYDPWRMIWPITQITGEKPNRQASQCLQEQTGVQGRKRILLQGDKLQHSCYLAHIWREFLAGAWPESCSELQKGWQTQLWRGKVRGNTIICLFQWRWGEFWSALMLKAEWNERFHVHSQVQRDARIAPRMPHWGEKLNPQTLLRWSSLNIVRWGQPFGLHLTIFIGGAAEPTRASLNPRRRVQGFKLTCQIPGLCSLLRITPLPGGANILGVRAVCARPSNRRPTLETLHTGETIIPLCILLLWYSEWFAL